MKVLSTHISKPRHVIWDGSPVVTGIYKEPVEQIVVRKFFIEGDTVADLRVHGGEKKAVYGYPSEHYPYWCGLYPNRPLPFGMFGENMTTEGLLEGEVIIGSVYRVGTALLRVTQPRMPCYKLAAKFGTNEIIPQFLKSRKSGFYFTVLEEGVISPGDTITLEKLGDGRQTIVDAVDLRDREPDEE